MLERTPAISIRPLAGHAELEACVALQEEIWGPGFNEGVPASLLAVVPRVGGVAAGAFDPSGRLVGFVFGLTGPDERGLLHWSDMLGVAPAARGQGIAERLKRWQAEAARRAGATRMQWTFDPLQAPNAWLNIERLGARVVAYVPDMYPGSTSPLHAGGTDRLLVEWALGEAPAASPVPRAASRETRTIEIPAAIDAVTSAGDLARLRATVRQAFTEAFADGFAVTGFARGTPRGRYLLAR